jgi:hypothetical protein
MNEETRKKDPEMPEGGRSGGIDFHGNVYAPGANIAGRDLNISETTGLSAQDLSQLFLPLLDAIQEAPPEKQPEAMQKAEELQQELAKGEKADDNRVAKLVDGLVNLVPGAVSAVGAIFAQPVLAGLAGPVTRFVLEKLLGG